MIPAAVLNFDPALTTLAISLTLLDLGPKKSPARSLVDGRARLARLTLGDSNGGEDQGNDDVGDMHLRNVDEIVVVVRFLIRCWSRRGRLVRVRMGHENKIGERRRKSAGEGM